MNRLEEFRKHLKKGKVYRRTELAQWSKSIDRHLDQLLKDKTLQKLSAGVYYYPKESAFGKTPPDEEELVRSFLKDNRFLLTSANAYNSLGVGTTQLYNKRTVYNHKRHGEFKLGNRTFFFQVKHHFPAKLTPEFLLIDLLNNLESLGEDHGQILRNILVKADTMDIKKLRKSVALYGSAKAKKELTPILGKVESLKNAS